MKRCYTCFIVLLLFVLCIKSFPVVVGAIRDHRNLEVLEGRLQSRFEGREILFDINGAVKRVVCPIAFIKDGGMVARRDDGRIIIPQDKCDISLQCEGIANFRNFCDENGVGFLYTNFPSQCGSDAALMNEGIFSFCSDNSKRLMEFLEKQNIAHIDFSECFPDGYNNKGENIFYKTDHHWTTETGLCVSRNIMEYCNNYFGLNFNIDNLEDEKFNRTEYHDCWLGETGRYVSYGWTGELDDYTVIEPKYETDVSYDVPEKNVALRGQFDCLIDKETYENSDLYNSLSWHYSYLYPSTGFGSLHNYRCEDEPTVLFIRDSFGVAVAPFMLLGSKDVIMWDIRSNKGNIEEYIKENDIDVVIVGYTEGSSIAKPKMFNFEGE